MRTFEITLKEFDAPKGTAPRMIRVATPDLDDLIDLLDDHTPDQCNVQPLELASDHPSIGFVLPKDDELLKAELRGAK